jgi:hypothetical protein
MKGNLETAARGLSGRIGQHGAQILFAILWTGVISSLWGHIKVSRAFHAIVNPGVSLAWPGSLIYVATVYVMASAILVWLGLGIYLFAEKHFGLSAFVRGAFMSLIFLVVADGAGILLGPNFAAIFWWLPPFFALLLSVWFSPGGVRRIERIRRRPR